MSIKETNQKGVEDELKKKEAEEKLEVVWKLNTIEGRSGDGSSVRERNIAKVVQGHVEDEQLWKL